MYGKINTTFSPICGTQNFLNTPKVKGRLLGRDKSAGNRKGKGERG
jgi:hypothetical protein